MNRVHAQDAMNIEQQYDMLTAEWISISKEMKSYEGLASYCLQPEFSARTRNVLQSIHHYDSIILDILEYPSPELNISNHEYKKTLKDIEKFESEYSFTGFIKFLKIACEDRKHLEKNKDELSNEVGMESYDSQVMLLEIDLSKVLKHIDKRIKLIDEHIHLIKPDQVLSHKNVSGQ